VNCSKWERGCGACPALSLPPAIESDATAFNWQRKHDIFAASKLYVTAPTEWLLDRARRSMLAPAMADSRLIPSPLDTRCFRPAPKAEARAALGLPPDVHLLVFAAFQARSNPYKDCATVEAAVHALAELMPDADILCVALGQESPELRCGKLRVQFLPFQPQEVVIRYLQAADIYLHAAKEENFGLVAAEAQACGTPVVATGVGGLPEVVADGQRGLIVPPGDGNAMAAAAHRLLTDAELRHRLGAQAADYARRNWEQEVVLDAVLAWIGEGLEEAPVAA
jgi:glycosyltransferase involved in cell wall biosynthesis